MLTSGPVDTAVPAEVRDQLLPVLREAVSNVARHAHADHAQVEVHVSATELRLSVSDDGIGLAEDRSESGLRNVRRRAAGLGGSVELSSNETEGHHAGVAGADPGGWLRPDAQKGPVTPPSDRSLRCWLPQNGVPLDRSRSWTTRSPGPRCCPR